MKYDLPKKININGEDHEIRTDFRVILDIMECIGDPDLKPEEKTFATIKMFYPKWYKISDFEEAIKQCFKFIDMGDDKNGKKSPRLIDWEKDFQYIIAPINRVLGYEARETNHLHWWTFMGAYLEIGGDCMFSQIVNIRDKQSRGKQLTKEERQWLRRNADIINLPQKFSESDNEELQRWLGGGSNG